MNVLIGFAGTPATTELFSISFVTTAPAPMKTFLPIFKFGKIVALVPIVEKSPVKPSEVIVITPELSATAVAVELVFKTIL